jgi:hypothetical protein
MKTIFLILVFFLILKQTQSWFCSSICKINACVGITQNDCNSQCSTNWKPSGSTCIVDPNLYVLVDTSADLGGLISFTPAPGITTCSSYSFTGYYKNNDVVIVDLVDGITVPYFEITIYNWGIRFGRIRLLQSK